MRNSNIKISVLVLSALLFTTAFYSGAVVPAGTPVAQASFFDFIRALVTINPLEVDVLSLADTEIDRVFRVEAAALNKGEDAIESAEAQIFVPEGLVVLGGSSVKQMGVIRGERDKKVFWQVRGEEIGSYVISVKVSGILGGTEISDEDSALVEIIERGAPGRRNFLQILRDFFNF